MKIAIIHPGLNFSGGAERLCLATIEALRNKGHSVSLITVEKTDWQTIQKNFGVIIKPNKEVYALEGCVSKNLTQLPVATSYFLTYILQLLVSKSKHDNDLLINTFGDVVNSVADVTYVHFPLRAALAFSQIPAFASKSVWQAVMPLYTSVVSLLDKVSPGVLLTNSRFMQQTIEKFLHRNSAIVYPPVDVEHFSSKCFKSQKEGCTVAVVASYTPKRHLERVPLIARHTKFAKFVVMGKADRYSLPTLEKLKKQMNTLHVKDKITLLTNVPYEEFLGTLSQAKVYLHTMPHDHFGISVVEAMSAGCVPVVHRSGGPWLDILDNQQGKYGFSYTSAEEAANYIDQLVVDENFRSEIASRTLYRAKRFDKKVFMDKMVEVVEKIA